MGFERPWYENLQADFFTYSLHTEAVGFTTSRYFQGTLPLRCVLASPACLSFPAQLWTPLFSEAVTSLLIPSPYHPSQMPHWASIPGGFCLSVCLPLPVLPLQFCMSSPFQGDCSLTPASQMLGFLVLGPWSLDLSAFHTTYSHWML